MNSFWKTMLIVNGCLVFSFGAFYLLMNLCLTLGVQPWIGALVYLGLYAVFLRREYRRLA